MACLSAYLACMFLGNKQMCTSNRMDLRYCCLPMMLCSYPPRYARPTTSGSGSGGGRGSSAAASASSSSKLANAVRLTAGSALVHMLVFRPSLVAKLFSVDSKATFLGGAPSSSSSRAAKAGLGESLDGILKTLESVQLSRTTPCAAGVHEGSSHGYASLHGQSTNTDDSDGAAETPPRKVVVPMADRDEGLARCGLNLLQLLFCRYAVTTEASEQQQHQQQQRQSDSSHSRSVGGGGGGGGGSGGMSTAPLLEYSEVVGLPTPTSLIKLRDALLLRKRRLLAILLGLLSPAQTASATVASQQQHHVHVLPSETIRAKAALVLRQFLSLDEGTGTVLEYACERLRLDVILERGVRATLNLPDSRNGNGNKDGCAAGADEAGADSGGAGATSHQQQGQLIQSPYCKAAVCLLADTVADIALSGLQAVQAILVDGDGDGSGEDGGDTDTGSASYMYRYAGPVSATAAAAASGRPPAAVAKFATAQRKLHVLCGHVLQHHAVRRVAEDRLLVHHAVVQRVDARGAPKQPPASLTRWTCFLVHKFGTKIPGMIFSALGGALAASTTQSKSRTATALGYVDGVLGVWRSLLEAAQVLLMLQQGDNSRKPAGSDTGTSDEDNEDNGEVDLLSSVLLPTLCKVAAVACGGIAATARGATGSAAACAALQKLAECTLRSLEACVRRRMAACTPTFGASLARHMVPLAASVLASFRAAVRQEAADTKHQDRPTTTTTTATMTTTGTQRASAGLSDSVDVLLSTLEWVLTTGPATTRSPHLQPASSSSSTATVAATTTTTGVSPVRLVVLAMVSTGLLGDGLAALMGWRDVRKTPAATYLAYLAASNLLVTDTGRAQQLQQQQRQQQRRQRTGVGGGGGGGDVGEPWTPKQRDLVLAQAALPRWGDPAVLRALAAASGAPQGNHSGAAVVTAALLIRPPFHVRLFICFRKTPYLPRYACAC